MQLYNSLSRSCETIAISSKPIKMYVCGVTPYDTTHVGHAFTYVFFDTLKRVLEYQGCQVIYTQNVTDVDDDLLKRARETNTDWVELGRVWTTRYLGDMASLNVALPTHFIRATESIDEIITIVSDLIEKKNAYVVGKTVFFDTKTYSEYGVLSGFSTEEMVHLSRERGANPDDKRKRNPLDFILWQESLKGEPTWGSPWGKGRPGWHIECSSMIRKTLGDTLDIHGGGFDLIYPHHESERAQSESATGKKPFVKFWTHTAMVEYESEKMSKSLGNLVHVQDLLKTYSASSIRYVLLSHHYRTTWEFVKEELITGTENMLLVQKAVKSIQNKVEIIPGEMNEGIEALLCDMQTQDAVARMLELAGLIVSTDHVTDLEKRELLSLFTVLGFILR